MGDLDLGVSLRASLDKVFGIGVGDSTPAYVDRGALDKKFRKGLESAKHVSVHGGSKQGKTWLRKKGLEPKKSVVVQCTITSTAASILEEALSQLGVHASLTKNVTGNLTGNIDIDATVSGKLGVPFLTKAAAEMSADLGLEYGKETETQQQILGQTVANLHWVAASINASKKKLVLEDFHYLTEAEQRIFASWMKALGEYGCHVLIIGVWAQSHLLTYYNGDLEGRVTDIHLEWNDDELKKVLNQGASALEIRLSEQLVDQIVTDSYGNVGLVHRIAERLLELEDVDSVPTWARIDIGSQLGNARQAIADEMAGRFETFASNFVRGMRRMPEGLVVYLHLLKAVTNSSDESLLGEGVDSSALLAKLQTDGIRRSDLSQALERVDKLQVKIDISPPVLTYHKSGKRVQIVDRSFLFYRKYGSQTWPWDEAEPIDNDLAKSAPLDLFDDLLY